MLKERCQAPGMMFGKMNNKWDIRFLRLAEFWANQCSKDPSTKTGAVIVRPDLSICSIGFNGFPQQTDDSPELYENRETKYPKVIHAEMNASAFAREELTGYTLYVWPFFTCNDCAKWFIQKKIGTVVSPITPPELEYRWGDSLNLSRKWYNEAGIEYRELDL